jgi:hypothetical protein
MTDLIRRAYDDTRQFFFADWKHFLYPPPSNRDFGGLGWGLGKLDQSQIVTKIFTQLRLNAKKTCFSSLENCVSSWWERWFLLKCYCEGNIFGYLSSSYLWRSYQSCCLFKNKIPMAGHHSQHLHSS